MKIVVIGGSGRIGARLVRTLQHDGVNVLGASASHGVKTITGEGLKPAASARWTSCSVLRHVRSTAGEARLERAPAVVRSRPGVFRRTHHSSPASAKLVYRPRPMMT